MFGLGARERATLDAEFQPDLPAVKNVVFSYAWGVMAPMGRLVAVLVIKTWPQVTQKAL